MRLNLFKMAVSGANLHNVFMLLTLEPLLAQNPFLVLHVRRDHLVSDALRELTIYNDVDLKKPLKVREPPRVPYYELLKSNLLTVWIRFQSHKYSRSDDDEQGPIMKVRAAE